MCMFKLLACFCISLLLLFVSDAYFSSFVGHVLSVRMTYCVSFIFYLFHGRACATIAACIIN